MKSFLDWLNHNPWLNVISLALGILGIVLAVVFFLKARRTKKLWYTTSSLTLIRSDLTQIPGLSIEHAGRPVKSLVVTDLTFWNQGREVIDRKDVASKDPLLIKCAPEVTVFSMEVSGVSGEANDFRIQKADELNLWTIEFDYMGCRDGMSARLMHSATTEPFVKVVGTVKGGSPVKFIHSEGYYGIIENMTMIRRYQRFLSRFEPKSSGGPAYWFYWFTIFFVFAWPFMIISMPFTLADVLGRPVSKPPRFGAASER